MNEITILLLIRNGGALSHFLHQSDGWMCWQQSRITLCSFLFLQKHEWNGSTHRSSTDVFEEVPLKVNISFCPVKEAPVAMTPKEFISEDGGWHVAHAQQVSGIFFTGADVLPTKVGRIRTQCCIMLEIAKLWSLLWTRKKCVYVPWELVKFWHKSSKDYLLIRILINLVYYGAEENRYMRSFNSPGHWQSAAICGTACSVPNSSGLSLSG